MWQLSCFTWLVPLACPTGGALRQAVAGASQVRMWILLSVYEEESGVSWSAACSACWLVSGLTTKSCDSCMGAGALQTCRLIKSFCAEFFSVHPVASGVLRVAILGLSNRHSAVYSGALRVTRVRTSADVLFCFARRFDLDHTFTMLYGLSAHAGVYPGVQLHPL
jgi:hypothetical protein